MKHRDTVTVIAVVLLAGAAVALILRAPEVDLSRRFLGTWFDLSLRALFLERIPTAATATFPELLNRVRSSGSIRMRLSLPWIQPPGLATVATQRRIASSETFTRPPLFLERLLHHQMVSADRTGEAAIRCSVLQRIQSSKFRSPEHRASWYSGKTFHTNCLRRADVHHIASDRLARSWIGRRQQSPNDRVSGTTTVLKGHPSNAIPACGRVTVKPELISNCLIGTNKPLCIQK